MNEKVRQFLDAICVHIKYKPIHQDIRDELAVHVDELKEEFVIEAHDEEAALDMAIAAMGDCGDIGIRLNKLHKPQTDWALIALTAVIAIMGGIMMYLSSRSSSYQSVDFERYLICAALGIAVMIWMYFFDYMRLQRLAWPVYLLSLAFSVGVLLLGAEISGVRAFINIGGLWISTEFTTLLFLVSFAGFVEKASGKGLMGVLGLCAIAAVPLLLIILQPKLLQALTLSAAFAVLIIMAVLKNHFGGDRKRQMIVLGVIASLCAFMLIAAFFHSTYLSRRFESFITRGQSDPQGMGYLQILADKWLRASNLFGPITEQASEIGLRLPEGTTDYVIVNVFATLGRVIGIALIIAVAFYIVRMFITSGRIKNSYGRYLSYGSCTILAVQYVLGILINFGLFPPTSVYIPFISYGGVGYIVSMTYIGLILSTWRRNNLISSPVRMR